MFSIKVRWELEENLSESKYSTSKPSHLYFQIHDANTIGVLAKEHFTCSVQLALD